MIHMVARVTSPTKHNNCIYCATMYVKKHHLNSRRFLVSHPKVNIRTVAKSNPTRALYVGNVRVGKINSHGLLHVNLIGGLLKQGKAITTHLK